MPVIADSTYRPGWLYRRTHPSTILPTLIRSVPDLRLVRERLETPDGDFIDLDCLRGNADRAVILCHGLEGNARRKYMLGMAAAFVRRGWDVIGYNFRGCGGEPNRLPGSYHAGATGDLRTVISGIDLPGYRDLALVGFSLGGNLVLKYLGEDPAGVHPAIRAAAAFSVPVELGDSCRLLAEPENRIYQVRFMRRLGKKIRLKSLQHPDQVDAGPLRGMRTLRDFDEIYTGPLHGFADAEDYYRRNSSRQFLPGIGVPTLLVNAKNDPFLPPSCYPYTEAEESKFFYLETPEHGGHTGFHAPGHEYWSDRRAVEFISAALPGASK